MPPRGLAWLPGFLLRVDPRPWRFVLKAAALALGPSLVLSFLVGALLPHADGPDLSFSASLGAGWTIFLLVLVSPVLETLLLVPIVFGLLRLGGPAVAAFGSALVWGVLHGLQAPVWGLIVWWPFLVMAVALMTWRRAGLGRAVTVVIAVHALQNAVGAALLLTLGA